MRRARVYRLARDSPLLYCNTMVKPYLRWNHRGTPWYTGYTVRGTPCTAAVLASFYRCYPFPIILVTMVHVLSLVLVLGQSTLISQQLATLPMVVLARQLLAAPPQKRDSRGRIPIVQHSG